MHECAAQIGAAAESDPPLPGSANPKPKTGLVASKVLCGSFNHVPHGVCQGLSIEMKNKVVGEECVCVCVCVCVSGKDMLVSQGVGLRCRTTFDTSSSASSTARFRFGSVKFRFGLFTT
jgi:hypothetical protein